MSEDTRVKVVVMGPYYWGAGKDLATAKRNFRAEGGRLTRGYVILTFDDETEFKGVDGMGRVSWIGNEPASKRVASRD